MTTSRGYQTGKHLEAFILLWISITPSHGGAVISGLKDLLPSAWTIDDGHVYRLLRTLEADGALASTWVTEGGGPAVRVYHITSRGRERLAACKEDIELRMQSLQKFLNLWSQGGAKTQAEDS